MMPLLAVQLPKCTSSKNALAFLAITCRHISMF